MEAKDTILSDAEIRWALKLGKDWAQDYGKDRIPIPERQIAIAQANRTWPIAFEEGRKAGEVVGVLKGREEAEAQSLKAWEPVLEQLRRSHD